MTRTDNETYEISVLVKFLSLLPSGATMFSSAHRTMLKYASNMMLKKLLKKSYLLLLLNLLFTSLEQNENGIMMRKT